MSNRSDRASSVLSIDGYVVIDKPSGMTSHDVVARARKLLSIKKIGHAGTLDPGATGVLVLGIGRATRLLRFVGELPKRYRGEIVFGETTTTLDNEGKTLDRFEMAGLDEARVRDGALALTGEIDQLPPMVSAVKVKGRRLYELAREGVEVERERRRVTVSRFTTAPTSDPLVFGFVVECSSGTYVRSLAADLGSALGGGAHLRRLRREAIGRFVVEEAIALDALEPRAVRPAVGLVSHLATLPVESELASKIANGAILPFGRFAEHGEGPWAVVDKAGRLLGVYERAGADQAKPTVVIAEPHEVSGNDRSDGDSTLEQG